MVRRLRAQRASSSSASIAALVDRLPSAAVMVDVATHAHNEKSSVALSSLLAAVLLTCIKLVVGWMTSSLGILSEAAHSGLDLVAAGVTFWAVRAASRPADREHTYGHGKFENLSALFETLLLLATCGWIVYESVERLFFRPVKVETSIWGFVVMAVSIAVDVGRSRALARAARKYQSQALEADALHFSTDVWSSSVVIVGLACVFLADKLDIGWLHKADAAAALGVAAIVVWVSLRLGKKTIDDLLDAVAPGTRDRVEQAARVDGVLDVRQVRIRRAGPEVFADVVLTVPRNTALERAHDIATEAESAIARCLPGADVIVHVEPVVAGNEGLLTTIRLIAARRGLGVHGIRIDRHGDSVSVEMHVEVPDDLGLDAAHRLVSGFEAALKEAVPDLSSIVSHIDPVGDASATRIGAPADEIPILQALDQVRAELGIAFAARDLRVRRIGHDLAVSFTCDFDGAMPITDVHAWTDKISSALRQRIPSIGRVVVHAEPPEDAGPAA
jgi:cation diffusion facilitator family transporter